jgi:hypothetical protein
LGLAALEKARLDDSLIMEINREVRIPAKEAE